MFDNIGGKIKGLATIICWIGIIGSIIGGISSWIAAKEFNFVVFLIGFGIIVGGSLVSWIGCFTTYALGELVDNTTDILAEQKAIKRLLSAPDKAAKKDFPADEAIPEGACQYCGSTTDPIGHYAVQFGSTTHHRKLCENCAKKLSATPVFDNQQKQHVAKEVSTFLSGNCWLCDKKDIPVTLLEISDESGIRHICLCKDCQAKYNATPTDP